MGTAPAAVVTRGGLITAPAAITVDEYEAPSGDR